MEKVEININKMRFLILLILFFLGIVFLYGYTIYGLNLKPDFQLNAIVGAIFLFFLWMLYRYTKLLKVKNPCIVMDETGISFNTVDKAGFVSWNELKDWKIETERGSESDWHYLILHTAKKRWKLYLSNLDKNPDEIRKIMESFTSILKRQSSV